MAIADTSGQDVALPARSSRRFWAALAGGAVVLAIAAALLLAPTLRWLQAEATVPFERLRVATVAYGDLTRDVAVEGRIVAAVSPTLFATADGTITLFVESGDEVQAGDELARVDSPDLENRLKQERASLESNRVELDRQRITSRQTELESAKAVDLAQIALTTADRELRRAKQAFEKGAIPAIDVEKAEDELHNAELSHQHALADIDLDRERLAFELRTREFAVERQGLTVADLERQVSELSIRSPVTGIVGNLQVQQKAAVTRNKGVMTVVDLSAFEIEANVPESYSDELGLSMPAEALIGRDLHAAEIVAVSAEVVTNQVTTRLKFKNSPPPGLRQNQRLTVRVLLEHKPNVLKVERGQFLESGAGRIAYVLVDGIAQRREIAIGARSLADVEVLSGLQAGDVIVTSSYENFDGAATVLVTD